MSTGDPDQHSQRPSYGLNRTWRSTLKIQFQFEEIMFALAGRRLTGNVQQRKMKLSSPRVVWVSGLLVLLAAFVYAGVTGAGVPYQDPTPEMRAREISQNRIIDTLASIGGILLVAGLIWAALLRIFTKKKTAEPISHSERP